MLVEKGEIYRRYDSEYIQIVEISDSSSNIVYKELSTNEIYTVSYVWFMRKISVLHEYLLEKFNELSIFEISICNSFGWPPSEFIKRLKHNFSFSKEELQKLSIFGFDYVEMLKLQSEGFKGKFTFVCKEPENINKLREELGI